jgi:GNAT superfamily N-acetyltransferase
MRPALFYCADGNRRFVEIAIEQGFRYGAQLPNTIYYPPRFVDQNWKNPNRAAYMAALKEYRPSMATVLDWEFDEQLETVLSWADEAARYVDTVVIIPKVMGGIGRIPDTVRGKPIRLGYSVPTSFGGTCLPVWEFGRRPVHLLGGSPGRQLDLANYLNVQSADGNYSTLMAIRYGQFYANNKQGRGKTPEWPKLHEVLSAPAKDDVPYLCFRLSSMNIRAAWLGCRAMLRYATETDIPAIKRIANQYKQELGFVNSAALKESIKRFELYVAEYLGAIVGFVNWHRRRDGWSTVYEIAVDRAYRGQHIGRALLESVPEPRRLKHSFDNVSAEGFYTHTGGQIVRLEEGRKRLLVVREWNSQQPVESLQ